MAEERPDFDSMGFAYVERLAAQGDPEAAEYVERSKAEIGAMMSATVRAIRDVPRVLARQVTTPAVDYDEVLDDMQRSLDEKEAERKEALELARRADARAPWLVAAAVSGPVIGVLSIVAAIVTR